ncbi:1-acyl-sn-glycerol-3-phosphate acyltransferase [Gordonia pseudamarae]|uniref:1-acyl-sn-glycerol-3-phosphate acyltransferase n=1 Tax=Gordonia pseudamarae TaxID=2831662 RepID=A0ABX6ICB1_9ACTN|nr:MULTISPECIES: lysophospholipid acyltransferase family protein [Gordonia]MBD0024351.1 1-acyl-sn-glycerol-3-phosphate acyltransferase [Gordonia sp. (in: high G+C Gram-positive bacteria)]QHN24649.1 1-acyl-sn-glycerol-3-phosphate acyltransferase [Gordonia pseudamarae]QHN33579.1 1-acyl-sn-glycerol-3-phosphate acyltransferase [Gordonia pseudamarae]
MNNDHLGLDTPAPAAGPRPAGLGFRAGLWTRFVRRILRIIATLKIVRVRVVNRDVVPASGPVILASNHISMLDGVFLWGALRRRAQAIAMAELWKWPIVGFLVTKADFIPVRRGDAASGNDALARMENALRHGGAVIIYPEGRVVPPGESVRFKPGAAVLAFRTRTPIIPVKIVGSGDLLPLKRFRRDGKSFDRSKQVTLYFGTPLDPEDYPTPGDLLRELRWSVDALG